MRWRSWKHRLHPRRGGAPVPAVTVDSAAPGEVAERLRNEAMWKVIETALASSGQAAAVEAVVEAGLRYGDEVAEAIAAMFAADPLEILPARIPKVPWPADFTL